MTSEKEEEAFDFFSRLLRQLQQAEREQCGCNISIGSATREHHPESEQLLPREEGDEAGGLHGRGEEVINPTDEPKRGHPHIGCPLFSFNNPALFANNPTLFPNKRALLSNKRHLLEDKRGGVMMGTEGQGDKHFPCPHPSSSS